jgi:hypothetical protein
MTWCAEINVQQLELRPLSREEDIPIPSNTA